MEPTSETYQALQRGYDVFNAELFGGLLPKCLITLQRKRRTFGYYCPDQFAGAAGAADEIALNPQFFATRPTAESLSTLVHEMVHQWQRHHGKPGRGRYHNSQWADKMESVGLMPSNTGQPGGKRVGDQMTHFILSGGLFDQAAARLLAAGYLIPWGDRPADSGEDGESEGTERNKSNRLKFTCPDCGANAWGKPDLKLICGTCRVDFVSPDAEPEATGEAA